MTSLSVAERRMRGVEATPVVDAYGRAPNPVVVSVQWQNGLGGAWVSTSALAVGDLLYFGGSSPHHPAIYVGAGYMVEAQQSGTHIMVSPVAGRGLSGALRVFR